MKVIIAGVTGLVGSTVLKRCIKDLRITSIVALSRRELPAELSEDKRVKVIVHDDFSRYPDELLKELNGAKACLWQAHLCTLASSSWTKAPQGNRRKGERLPRCRNSEESSGRLHTCCRKCFRVATAPCTRWQRLQLRLLQRRYGLAGSREESLDSPRHSETQSELLVTLCHCTY